MNKKIIFTLTLACLIVTGSMAKAVSTTTVASNSYFKARVGTFWLMEGASQSPSGQGRLEKKVVKTKHQVVGVVGKAGSYTLQVQSTDQQTGRKSLGTIVVKKNSVTYNLADFYLYVSLPLKTGKRWPSNPGEKLVNRADDLYQNIAAAKTAIKNQSQDCFKIVFETLADKAVTTWCNQIGVAADSFEEKSSQEKSQFKIVNYRY